jgi:capsular exopolysaccharide synthesis family protein
MSTRENEYVDEESVDLLELLFKYLRHWKWFAASVAVALVIAFVYLRYATPVYEVKTTVLLKDDRRGGGADLAAFQEMSLFNVKNNVDNEIEILRTVSLMERVVKEMDIYVEYYMSGRVKTSERYGQEAPIQLWVNPNRKDSIPNALFEVEFSKNGTLLFTGEYDDEKYSIQAKVTDTLIVLPFMPLQMKAMANVEPGTKVEVRLRNPTSVAQGILGNLSINLTGKTTSVVNVSLNTVHPQKGKDILTKYVYVYNDDNMSDQNMVAENTAAFLDERLAILTEELADVEQKVERYKQSEELTDISSEAKLFLEQSSANEQKRLETETQLSIVRDLEAYLSAPGGRDQLLPAGTGLQSSSLNSLIGEYNTLLLQRNRLRRTASADNQAMLDLTAQLESMAESVHASIAREKRNLNIVLEDIKRQATLYSSRITSIPRQEREFLEIQRQQSVKAALYLFLLQKKEENFLSMTVVVPKAKVIDVARSSGNPIAPRKMIVLLVALMLGLGLPVAVIFIREQLRFYIENKSELEKLTKVPVLGEIPKSSELGTIVLHEHSTNTLAEMYRLLRTNLLFVLGTDHKKVLLVTSSVGGEGKTFMSINLGLSLAFLNKRVLVIGLDVRKPKLAEYLGMDNKTGITLYLSGHMSKDKLIRPSGVHKNLDVLPAGPIPPNPNELLARQELDDLIAHYRETYDYIILDSAPVGAVSDSYQLNRFADVCLYVVRAEYTHKQNIIDAEDNHTLNKLTNMYFVLNASDVQKSGYRYGYRYGYGKKYGYGGGYGYGYGEENP